MIKLLIKWIKNKKPAAQFAAGFVTYYLENIYVIER